MNHPDLFKRRWVLALVASAALTACGTIDSTPAPEAAYTLQVLHLSDMDTGGDLVNNSKGLSALVKKFRAEMPANTVFLSSGDNYIPGPFFNAADDASLNAELGAPSAGRGDIAILNAMGLQASAFGNHEFDNGTNTVAGLLRSATSGGRTWPGTKFPYLSTNLDFSKDSNLAGLAAAANDGQPAAALGQKIAKYTVINVAGQDIGVVGATTPILASITTVGGVTIRPDGAQRENIDALAAAIQPSVDALTARGINKIILLAHMQQLPIERALAPKLKGVDLIVAGGSNTGLYDSTDRVRPGDTKGGDYPLRHTSASGEPVLVVNVDSDYKYLGRIVLPFDAQGRIIERRLDAKINGAWASDAEGLQRAGLTAADAMPEVVAIANKLGQVIASKDGNLFGATTVYLEGDRVLVRNQETNLGNLSSDANLAWAQTVDPSTAISFKNGGGIRSSIGYIDAPPGSTSGGTKAKPPANKAANKLAGDVSQLDIEFSLRFNNGLSLLSANPAELKALLEHGVSDWTPTSTQGKFPQVGGLRFSFDPSRPAGQRVATIVVDDPDGAGPLRGPQVVYAAGAFKVPATATYRLVTLDFLADGGDAYPFKSLAAPNRVNLIAAGAAKGFTTPGGEQNALAAYLKARYPRSAAFTGADVPATADSRIINLSVRPEALPQN